LLKEKICQIKPRYPTPATIKKLAHIDATELGEETPAEFEVNITAQRHYLALNNQLFKQVKQIAA